MTSENIVVTRKRLSQQQQSGESHDGPRNDIGVIGQRLSAEYISSSDAGGSLIKRLIGNSTEAQAALAAWQVRKRARNYFSTGEDIALRLMPMLRVSGWGGRIYSVVHAAEGAKVRLLMKALGHQQIGTFFTVSSSQKDFLVQTIGIPEEKVEFVYDSVDTEFFDPLQASPSTGEGYIFACGQENRDYKTLARAAELGNWPVRVQASGYFELTDDAVDATPANFEVQRARISYADLRDRYTGARLAVVPLHNVGYAAGVNGLLEAMAMGKAVVVTDSVGLLDYTGLNSLVKVPPGDHEKLRDALDALWNDPAACAEMGQENRNWILSHARIEQYADTIVRHMLRS